MNLEQKFKEKEAREKEAREKEAASNGEANPAQTPQGLPAVELNNPSYQADYVTPDEFTDQNSNGKGKSCVSMQVYCLTLIKLHILAYDRLICCAMCPESIMRL